MEARVFTTAILVVTLRLYTPKNRRRRHSRRHEPNESNQMYIVIIPQNLDALIAIGNALGNHDTTPSTLSTHIQVAHVRTLNVALEHGVIRTLGESTE